MDIEEYKTLKEKFSKLSDETLLLYIREEAEDFSPDALDLIRDELLLRGYRGEDLRPAEGRDSPSTRPQTSGQNLSAGEVVIAAEFEDPFPLQQVVAILEQEGIITFTSGLSSSIVGAAGNYPAVMKIPLYVHERDLKRALEVIDSFPPPEDADPENE